MRGSREEGKTWDPESQCLRVGGGEPVRIEVRLPRQGGWSWVLQWLAVGITGITAGDSEVILVPL